MKKRKFYFRTLVGAGLIAAAAAFPAFADNWIHQEKGWVCKTADGYMPVSYTHLDVYKRQVSASMKELSLWRQQTV